MKTLFTLFLAFILCLQAKAQLSDSITYKQAAIFYNQDWEVTKKQKAAYFRIAIFPDSLPNISNLKVYNFDKSITDYYSNGAVMAKGFYDKGKRWGQWQFYYQSGQKEGEGMYDGVKQIGEWQFWRPDGKPFITINYDGVKPRIINYWDEQGTQLVTSGNGSYAMSLLAEDNITEMKLEGIVKDGLKEGDWVYSYTSGEPRLIQKYRRGERIDTKGFENGKRIQRLAFIEDFEVAPSYKYLDRVEYWIPDKAFFTDNYPLVAYVLGYSIAEKKLPNFENTEVTYYGVSDKNNPDAKEIEFGKQYTADEMPSFPGGQEAMSKFMRKHLKVSSSASTGGIIVITFDVDAEGNISNHKLLKGLNPRLDEEAMRVIKLMPKWVPAKINKDGRPFSYTLPIRF